MDQLGGLTFKPGQLPMSTPGTKPAADNVQQAIQMLSLRYPKASSAKSIVGDPSLLADTRAPRTLGFNPNAAILQALIRALSSGSPMASGGMDLGPAMPSSAASFQAPTSMPPPQFTPGVVPGEMPTGMPSPITREWRQPGGSF
jgi:hypothetical protein